MVIHDDRTKLKDDINVWTSVFIYNIRMNIVQPQSKRMILMFGQVYLFITSE
jgi:hypothetical protein